MTTTTEASLIPTLSGEYYTSYDVFGREMKEIFSKEWICTERAGELAKPGAFRTMQVADESVIIVRSRDGKLNAFLNSCRHRGTPICEDGRGETKRTLRCPYHAWTYDLDGRLIAAPNMDDMRDMDRGQYGLIPVALREFMGYIWLNLDENPVSFEDTVIAQANARFADNDSLAQYSLDDLAVGERRTYEVRGNWKLIVENFYECYHCATIHPQLVDILPEFRDGEASQRKPGHGAAFGEGVEGFTIDGSAGFDLLPNLSEDLDRKYFGSTIRPLLIINLVPDHAIFHRLYPLGPDRTLVECDWLFNADLVASGADLSRSVGLFAVNNLQDFDVCEKAQRGMSSRAYKNGGVFVPLEHHISDFHRWVTDRID